MAEMEEQIPKSILFRESLICFLKILFFSIQNEEHLLNKWEDKSKISELTVVSDYKLAIR